MRLVTAGSAVGFATLAAVLAHAEPAHSIKLCTYNLNFANPDRPKTIAAIEDANADVIVLQEVTGEWQHDLDKLAKRYPHRAYRARDFAGGSAVLSKLPIKTDELLEPPAGGWFPPQRIVVEAPFGVLQILNVHLRPQNDRGSWIRGFVTTRPIRRREIETYWPHLAHDVPTIVAGDFNEDPRGRAVEFLESNGFTRAIPDGPTTWHYDPLSLDIDHVMVDKSLTATDGHVLDAGTSDHRPVIVTITKP